MDAIVECVAWDGAKQGSANADATRTPRPFFESAAVSLWSVSRTNPQVERVLVTNTDVPADVARVLGAAGVCIVEQPFDAFDFSRDIPWYLAYYKLCALQRVVGGGEYGRVCMLDTDTFVRKPLSGLFEETGGGGFCATTPSRRGTRRAEPRCRMSSASSRAAMRGMRASGAASFCAARRRRSRSCLRGAAR